MQAFSLMDKDGSGEIDIDDIRGTYNARKHPDVINGKKTEEEVLLEFLETFEQHHNFLVNIKYYICSITKLVITSLHKKNGLNTILMYQCL